MKISVLVVGKVRGELEPAIREFETRAARYWKMEVLEVDAGVGRGGGQDERAVRQAEAHRLRARTPDAGEVWALTREGKALSSPQLARALGDKALEGAPGITFWIGGAYGLDPTLTRSADRTFSLSKCTLPHQFARLILAEQLYRSGTILRGEPYHKGRSS